MLTVTLALINAKYKAGYEGLFWASTFLDFCLITATVEMLKS